MIHLFLPTPESLFNGVVKHTLCLQNISLIDLGMFFFSS